jgi:hypothetical protein
MKILRSVNRRGFNVGSAGWFSILKPNTWFPASRLPGTFRYHGGQSAQSPALDHADTQQSTIPPRIMIPTTKDHGLIHPALVVVSAMAITSALLWWIMHP